MNKKVVLLVLVFVCSFAGMGKAQLFLEEGKVVLSVSAGERINKSITVSNTTPQEMEVRAYWEDFEYQPPYEGTKSFIPAGTSKESAYRMFSFSPQVFKIPPFGKQKIDYSINAPVEMTKGYYGVLFFERGGESVKNESGLTVVTRIGSLFFIEPNDKSKNVLIDNIKVDAEKLTGSFTNQGNIIIIPHMTYNIMDKEGLVADRGELKKLYVPPGASGSWEIAIPNTLAVGQYSLVLNTDLDGGDIVVKEINLTKDASDHLRIETIQD